MTIEVSMSTNGTKWPQVSTFSRRSDVRSEHLLILQMYTY